MGRNEVFSGLVYSVITSPNGTLIATVIHYANEKCETTGAGSAFSATTTDTRGRGPARLMNRLPSMRLVSMYDEHVVCMARGLHRLSGRHVRHESGDPRRCGLRLTRRSAGGACCPSTTPTITGPPARSTTAKSSSIPTTPITKGRSNGRTEHSPTWSARRAARGQPCRPRTLPRNPQHAALREAGRTVFHARAKRQQPADLVGDDPGPGSFVLYSSPDGIHWDEGIVPMSRLQPSGGERLLFRQRDHRQHQPDAGQTPTLRRQLLGGQDKHAPVVGDDDAVGARSSGQRRTERAEPCHWTQCD